MNYRHLFHAGNFADVHKHAVLVSLLMHLREKPAAFRVIDTHAGAGLYDLASPEAARTAEWHDGVGCLFERAMDAEIAILLAPYLDAVRLFNPDGELRIYPGSPALVRALLRPQDRLVACELEPTAATALVATLARDPRAKAVAIDGWTALNAFLPPKERRGLVLIDPPFEQSDEFDRLGEKVVAATRKWPSGIFMLWYPVKTGTGPQRLARRLVRAGTAPAMRSELLFDQASDAQALRGSGLIVINPPWRLPQQMEALASALARLLGRDGKGTSRFDWLVREK